MVNRDVTLYVSCSVPVRIVAANAAREIADALQEDDRLSGEEAGESIRDREGCEDEEAVGRDSLQHVDVLMLVSAAEFQLVLAAHPAERCGVVEDIFEGVAGAGDRITHCGIAIHLNEWRSRGDLETRLCIEIRGLRVTDDLRVLRTGTYCAERRIAPHR